MHIDYSLGETPSYAYRDSVFWDRYWSCKEMELVVGWKRVTCHQIWIVRLSGNLSDQSFDSSASSKMEQYLFHFFSPFFVIQLKMHGERTRLAPLMSSSGANLSSSPNRTSSIKGRMGFLRSTHHIGLFGALFFSPITIM